MTIAMLLRNTLLAAPGGRAAAGGGGVELSRLRPGELIAARRRRRAARRDVPRLVRRGRRDRGRRPRHRDLRRLQRLGGVRVTDLLLALAALIAIALAVVTATRRSPALPVAASVITAALGALATLLVLYRIVNQPGPNEFIEVKLPAFLGFLCVLAIAAGGWLSMRDEEWPDARCRSTCARRRPPRARASPRRRPRPSRAPRLHGRMLSRDQVLHVARLARLELSEEELERMGERALGRPRPHREDRRARRPRGRAADVARRRGRERAARRRAAPVAAARGRARGRARPRARRVPRPEPRRRARMSELLELTAAQAAEKRPHRRGRCRRAVDRLPRARAGRRAQRVHVGLRRDHAARGRAQQPARRRAARRQGPVLHRGDPEPGRLEDPRGLPPALHGDRRSSGSSAPARRCWPRPTRTSSRWAPRPRTAPTARCSTRGTARACPAAPPAAAPPRWRPARRRGRSAPTPAARSASPPRCAGSSGSSPPTARSAATG